MSALAEQVDIFPTILDLLGIARPMNTQGRSLVPVLTGQQIPPRPTFAKLGEDHLWSIRDDDWKLVLERTPRGRLQPALYDLSSGVERTNAASLEPIVALALESELLRHTTQSRRFSEVHRLRKADAPSSEAELDSETRHRLKALGYLE